MEDVEDIDRCVETNGVDRPIGIAIVIDDRLRIVNPFRAAERARD